MNPYRAAPAFQHAPPAPWWRRVFFGGHIAARRLKWRAREQATMRERGFATRAEARAFLRLRLALGLRSLRMLGRPSPGGIDAEAMDLLRRRGVGWVNAWCETWGARDRAYE